MTSALNIHFCASIHGMTADLSTMTNAISLERLGGIVWFEGFCVIIQGFAIRVLFMFYVKLLLSRLILILSTDQILAK